MQELGSMEDSSDEVIGFNTFFFRLKDQLQNKDLQQIKGKGGIVFSGLYPGMSMPKKVITFLGLNFGEFPRKSQELSFDLLPENKKLSSRIKDRGAFLETFLNAENRVLLSYIGQNVKDNSVIPSSAIISELQDYADKANANIKEVKHPLHSFNSKYFEEVEEDLFTYYREKNKQVYLKCGIDSNLKLPIAVSLSTLESFLKDPFQHHYNQALKIRYKEKEDLPEWEIFSLNDLQSWEVKNFCLKNKFNTIPSEFDQLRKEIIQKGKLPLKSFGEMNFQEAIKRVNLLWEKLEELQKDPSVSEEDISLDFTLKNNHPVHLSGKVQMLGGSGLLLNVSKRRKKYEIIAFVRYLALVASGKAQQLNYIHLNDEQSGAGLVSINNGWTPEQAYNFLKSWLQDLMDNYSKIIPFSPSFNFEVNDIATLALDEEGPEKLKRLINTKFGRFGNCYPSAYLQREYEHGFFEEEVNLVEFMHKYTSYLGPIEEIFN
jgi:exodeoxyribonuclease V gamma subunit